MAHSWLLISLGILALAIAALACGAPPDAQQLERDAQATSVRRTEVARVQNIISNPSTATPLPAPTATPSPTCPNAIWWTEARTHIGEMRTIQGTVVGTRPGPGGSHLIEVGLPYPDPLGLAIVLGSGDASALESKDVCATGRIGLVEGRPTLQLQDDSSLRPLQ